MEDGDAFLQGRRRSGRHSGFEGCVDDDDDDDDDRGKVVRKSRAHNWVRLSFLEKGICF